MKTTKKMSDKKAEEIAASLGPTVVRLDDALAGIRLGDAVLALSFSFMIRNALNVLEPQARTRTLSTLMALIDPDTPSAFKQ